MKKIFAVILSCAMILSCMAVFAVPVAAVDGAWTVYGPASQYADDFDGEPKSVPGYEYTDDGFHMIPADWTGMTPWGLIRTKEKVDLKDGVYMLVRVDDFSYDSTDRWFNFNIWDSLTIEPPVEGYGEGVQTLMRVFKDKKGDYTLQRVEWFTKNFTGMGTTEMTAEKTLKTDDGKILIEIYVMWDGNSYDVEINGATAPKSLITYMNTKWGGDDSEAYIGLCTQNNKTGGTASLTVTKFGNSKNGATTPMGDDSKAPENHSAEKAPIAPADTVPEGQPAVFMNGNRSEHDLKAMPKPIVNSTLTFNDDYSLHVTANQGSADSGVWFVKNEVSYDVKDFPIGVILTKNFCTCGYGNGICYAIESVGAYMLTGDSLGIGGNHINELSMPDKPYKVGNDSYLYFYVDMLNDAAFDAEGRINGACFDFSGIDYDTPGANSFDIVFMAWFRTVDDAQNYIEDYLKSVGWEGSEETAKADEETTETFEAVETVEEPAEVKTEKQTEEQAEVTTDKAQQPEEKPDDTKTDDVKTGGGCGAALNLGAFVIVSLVAGFVSFKKKND